MSSLLDFAALLSPITADNPAGNPFPYIVRQKLDGLRKEFEPNPESPSLPPVPRKPDWAAIKQLATETLSRTSKDLEVAFRLLEAMVKLHGCAGLRDGLHFMDELVNQCWDRLHPMPGEGEGMEGRAERFYWITELEKGARFPNSILGMPLLKANGQTLSVQEVLAEMKKPEANPASFFAGAEPYNAEAAADVAQGLESLGRLEQALTVKCAPDPPMLSSIREAVAECQKYLKRVEKAPPPAAVAPAAVAPGEAGVATDQAPSLNGQHGMPSLDGGASMAIATREEAYRQLEYIADVLEKLEPHSPIPDLLRRAIELGKMPFRDLIQQLIREPNMLTELRREFGIKKPS